MSEVAPAKWWQWPTILSLDAPAVAVSWQLLLARVFGVSVNHSQASVLGLSVWLAYTADRWIEAGRLDPAAVRTQRHSHYQKFRRVTGVLWAGVLFADVLIAFQRLQRRELEFGFSLLIAVALYVLSHQWIHRQRRGRVPKEFCVAALITGGVVLFPAANLARFHPAELGIILLFSALCFANCAFISVWEWEVDLSQGQTSLTQQFPGTHALVRDGTIGILGAAALSGILFLPPVRTPAFCVAASALALLMVDWCEPRFGRRAARVLADFVLLTPLVPLFLRS